MERAGGPKAGSKGVPSGKADHRVSDGGRASRALAAGNDSSRAEDAQKMGAVVPAGEAHEVSISPGDNIDSPKITADILNGALLGINGHFSSEPQPLVFKTKEDLAGTPKKERPCSISCHIMTTQEAVHVARREQYMPIIVNAANDQHQGGNPGVMTINGTTYPYQSRRANAQEEGCIACCTLAPLFEAHRTTISGRDKDKIQKGTMTQRNKKWEVREFKSELRGFSSNLVGTCEVDFFGTQDAKLGPCTLSDTISPAVMILNAAESHSGKGEINLHGANRVMKERITMQIQAAAQESSRIKADNPTQKTRFVFNAFGCGAFKPDSPEQAEAYRISTANAYKEVLGEYGGYFDDCVFVGPEDENYPIFLSILEGGEDMRGGGAAPARVGGRAQETGGGAAKEGPLNITEVVEELAEMCQNGMDEKAQSEVVQHASERCGDNSDALVELGKAMHEKADKYSQQNGRQLPFGHTIANKMISEGIITYCNSREGEVTLEHITPWIEKKITGMTSQNRAALSESLHTAVDTWNTCHQPDVVIHGHNVANHMLESPKKASHKRL
ncbi:MAG: hypothetical protein VW378_01505 [bacterium]